MLFGTLLSGQNNFFYSHDYINRSQGYRNVVEKDSEIYALGVTICNTGECGVLAKYDDQGELIFLKLINEVDVNSSRCFTLKSDTLMFITVAKFEVGSKFQKYNTSGDLLDDILVVRDSNLVYTWTLDALYEEKVIYLAVIENYENESQQAAIYKLDYAGNVVDYVRLPYHYRGSILTLTQLHNGNLFVSQRHINKDACAFPPEEPDSPNAVIFYEIRTDTMAILREKQDICYESTAPISYDCTVLPDGRILRNVLWRDSLFDFIIHASNMYYDENWEIIGIDKNPPLVVGNPLASYGIIGLRTKVSLDSLHFYTYGTDRYPIEGEDFPYGDFLIQKWDLNRNLLWERRISDPNVYKRINLRTLLETESGIILAGYTWSDFDIGATQDFAVMSLDHDGCFNGDCSDVIYLNGPPISVVDEEPQRCQVILSPNPVQDRLQITAKDRISRVACYTLSGELVEMHEVMDYEFTLTTDLWTSGIFFIRVATEQGVYAEKVIKL